MEDEQHLWNAGMEREREATLRWSFGHANELPNHLGLLPPRGWWCGFFLQRRDIFGEEADGEKVDGDIDFLAGPTRYSFGEDELAARLAVARVKDPQLGEARFHYDAGRAGRVVWPPEIQEVVACEIKASWFAHGIWKQTHVSSGGRAKIRKQLKLLCDYGVNRVALLHLGVTKPTDERIGTSLAALAQLDSAVESFPDAFPDTAVAYGHLRAVMAATHDGPESRAGAHAGVTTLRPAGLINPIVERVWHRRLQNRLAAMPPPMYLNTFILECPQCRRWRHSSSPDVGRDPCVCIALR